MRRALFAVPFYFRVSSFSHQAVGYDYSTVKGTFFLQCQQFSIHIFFYIQDVSFRKRGDSPSSDPCIMFSSKKPICFPLTLAFLSLFKMKCVIP